MNKRIIAVLIIVFGAIFGFISSSLADEKFSSLQCDIFTSSQVAGESRGKLYMKGDKSRIELNTSGMDTVTIISEGNAYLYMPSQNMAMKMPVTQAKEQVPSVEDYKNNCEFMGEEQVDSESCGVYRCFKNGQSMTMWVSNKLEFPLKIISSGATTYYKNVNTNMPLSDGLFSLPQGVQFQDMGSLMQGFGGN